jgi:hypothetical protein
MLILIGTLGKTENLVLESLQEQEDKYEQMIEYGLDLLPILNT